MLNPLNAGNGRLSSNRDNVAFVKRVVPSPPEIVPSALGKEAPLWGCVLVAANEARRQVRLHLRGTARVSA